MTDTIRIDWLDIVLSKESITNLLAEKRRELNELRGRLYAMGLELDKENAVRISLEDPQVLEQRVQSMGVLIPGRYRARSSGKTGRAKAHLAMGIEASKMTELDLNGFVLEAQPL